MILDDGGDATNFCQAKHPNVYKNLIGKYKYRMIFFY